MLDLLYRKKTRGEGQPDCGVCMSLELSCHGYGSKPEWMNGGVKESEVALGTAQGARQREDISEEVPSFS